MVWFLVVSIPDLCPLSYFDFDRNNPDMAFFKKCSNCSNSSVP